MSRYTTAFLRTIPLESYDTQSLYRNYKDSVIGDFYNWITEEHHGWFYMYTFERISDRLVDFYPYNTIQLNYVDNVLTSWVRSDCSEVMVEDHRSFDCTQDLAMHILRLWDASRYIASDLNKVCTKYCMEKFNSNSIDEVLNGYVACPACTEELTNFYLSTPEIIRSKIDITKHPLLRALEAVYEIR